MENTFGEDNRALKRKSKSLNPYFNGKYFLRLTSNSYQKSGIVSVLILILMENTF